MESCYFGIMLLMKFFSLARITTPYNVAFYYVYNCKQNKIKLNESKIDNYIERTKQPLIPDNGKENFKKIILEYAKSFSKNK